MGERPLGFEAAAADWNEPFAGRPMNYNDWASLTIGEQQRYAASECKTKGAIYSSHVTADRVEFSVKLPPDLAMQGLKDWEARWIEAAVHKSLEQTIALMLTARREGWNLDPNREGR